MVGDDLADVERRIGEVFTPASPINRIDFFRGRTKQIRRVLDAIPVPGRHPVVYGPRGVGKTSLANIIHELPPDVMVAKVTCDSADTFKSIWNRILLRAPQRFKEVAFGFAPTETETVVTMADLLGKDSGVRPGEVADAMRHAAGPVVFILDEFNEVVDAATRKSMADLIKNVSDNVPLATFILVGVAGTIADLVGHHTSISRNLWDVPLLAISTEEIRSIMVQGFAALGITASEEVHAAVVELSEGLPHYAHLLGFAAAAACVSLGGRDIGLRSFEAVACPVAVDEAVEYFRTAFAKSSRARPASRMPRSSVPRPSPRATRMATSRPRMSKRRMRTLVGTASSFRSHRSSQ